MTKYAKIKRNGREIVELSDQPINLDASQGEFIVVQVDDNMQVGQTAPASAGSGQQQARDQQRQQQGGPQDQVDRGGQAGQGQQGGQQGGQQSQPQGQQSSQGQGQR